GPLLGCHIRGRPYERSGEGNGRPQGSLPVGGSTIDDVASLGPCESKVDDAHSPIVRNDRIFGLEVPVNDPKGMRRRERSTGLLKNTAHPPPGTLLNP